MGNRGAGMRSRWLPVLCTVLLAVQIALSSAGSHSQTSSSFAVGDVKLGGINSVAVGSYFVPVPLSDATLRDVVEFLVSELNRRESSTAGVRSTRSVLSASQQSLVTGHVYHVTAVVQGGRKGIEVVDAAVLDGKSGSKTVMKVNTKAASAMEVHDISVMEAKIAEHHGGGGAWAPEPVGVGLRGGFELETEFDAAFLDGIQIESRNSVAYDSSLSRSGDAAAAEAVRRLKDQASLPLPSANGRPRIKSRLTKA
mmetsp:Transcript_34934/g.62308  ORF Transcript_34934/g.62308 Transcript_34934/m.62308 type:complete len:254 (-) Transcript_34934:126-887(-)